MLTLARAWVSANLITAVLAIVAPQIARRLIGLTFRVLAIAPTLPFVLFDVLLRPIPRRA